MEPSNYWMRAVEGRVSRRTLLRGGAVAGVGLAGAALIGCGGSGSATSTPAATAAASGAAKATGTAAAKGTAAAATPKAGGMYKSSTPADPTNLDPMKSGAVLSKALSAFYYSRLMRIDTKEGADPFGQGVTPDAAASLESGDGQHWTIKLKQGVKFHNIAPVNGREMTSADVVFSFQRLTAPKSPNGVQMKTVQSFTAVDDYTINAVLDGPNPEFQEVMADGNLLYIQPVEADGKFDPSTQPIGTGAFLLKEFVSSQKISLLKHPDYFIKGIPYLDGIEQDIIPDAANVLAQFEAGNINEASISADQLLDLKKRHPTYSWQPGTGNGMAWLIFSGKEVSPNAVWRDARFRQGVSMSIDRDGLLELAAYSKELKAAGFDSPILSRWNNIPEPCAFGAKYWLDPTSTDMGDAAKYFKHDPAEAKKMFDAVGVGSTPVPYQYTNLYGPAFVSVAEASGNMMTTAGLPLQTEVQDYNSKYITHTFLGDFQGIAYGLESTLTPGGYAYRFFGQDPANHGRVHEPEMEALLQKQSVEMDPTARTKIFYDMARAQAAQMYYVPAQSTSTASWSGYIGSVQGVRRTRGYGPGGEVYPYIWLNA
jgi:peptide/nickel transport system substrate-binding protein